MQLGEQTIDVEVDFLADEYSGTTRGHRTQKVQDMRPRKARGCDLAVNLATEETLSGTLFGGGKDTNVICFGRKKAAEPEPTETLGQQPCRQAP